MISSHSMVLTSLVSLITLSLGAIFYRYIYPKRKINPLILIALISILPVISILRKGTYESGDLTLHTHYAMSFYEELKSGHIFPQWTNVGYGTPVFIFLYPLPFYFASLFHFIGFSFLISMKLVFISSYIGSGIAMYAWARNEFGKMPGFLASLVYLFAPFHFVDIHFRASVGESLSFAFIPLIFLFSKKIIETRKYKFLILGAISLAFLIMSHMATALVSIHLLVIYTFIVWIKKKNKRKIDLFYWAGSIILGLLLSSFYWIPAKFEVQYTSYYFTLPTTTFLSLQDLLYSPTMFGLLFQGHYGESHYLLGYTQLLLLALSIPLIFKIKNKREKMLLLFFQISFFTLSFMTLSVSKRVWETIFYLNNFQFSWRLLVPIAFILSSTAAITAKRLNKKTVILLCVFTILSTILNWGNRKMVPEQKENHAGYETLYTEYYNPSDPFYKKTYPKPNQITLKDISKIPVETISGITEIKQIYRNPTNHEYLINAKTDVIIKENTLYFPNWNLFINNLAHPIDIKNPEDIGAVTFKLKPGIYKAELKFQNTRIRAISQKITILSLLAIIITVLLRALYLTVSFKKNKL